MADPALEAALEIKLKGNVLFKENNFEEAIKLYSQAIDACPKHRYCWLTVAMQQNCQLSMLCQVTSDVSECMSVIYVISSCLSATLSQASRAGGDVPEPSSLPREDGEVGGGHQRLRPQHQEQQQVSRLAAQSWTKRTCPRMYMIICTGTARHWIVVLSCIESRRTSRLAERRG